MPQLLTPRPLSRPMLRAAALCAAMLGGTLPAGAQVLIYEGQPGLAPRGYPVPPGAYPQAVPYPAVPYARYPVLPPSEIRAIVQSMGYWNIGVPKLSGRFYLVPAADQMGRALLRVNAFTGRVVSARTIPGGPPVAAPAPQRVAPPMAPSVAPPSVARAAPPAAPALAGTPAPLPPPRPPEATMAAVTPAPAAPSSAIPAPASPAPASPAAPPAAAAAPAQPVPGAASPTAAAGQTAAQQSANAAPSATPSATPATAPAQPQKRKAGAGTATTDSAAAGTASVLSRPKSP